MVNRFWVGGDGTWDGEVELKWSTTSGGVGGASVPTSADDVFFDAGSDVAGVAFTVTVAAGNAGCRDVTANVGIVNGSTFVVDSPLTVSGKFDMAATGSFDTFNNNSTITFNGSGADLLIAWTSVGTRGPVVFDGTGSFLLSGVYATSLTLTRGTIKFDFIVEIDSLSSSNSNTRAIVWVSATTSPTLKGTGVVWDTTNTTGLTVTTFTNAVMNITPTATGNATVNAGSSSIQLVKIKSTLQSGSSILTLNNVNCQALELTTLTLADTNITMRGALVLNTGVTFSGSGSTLTFTGTASLSLSLFTVPRHFVINGSGITITLTNALILGSSNDITLTQGTFATEGANITCRRFTSTGSLTRSITGFNTSTMTLTGDGAIWNSSSSGFTTSSFFKGVTANNSSGVARTISQTGSAAKLGNLSITAGTGQLTLDNLDVTSMNLTGYTGQLQDGSLTIRGAVTLGSATVSSGVGIWTIILSANASFSGFADKVIGRGITHNSPGWVITFNDGSAGSVWEITGPLTLLAGSIHFGQNAASSSYVNTTKKVGAFISSGTASRAVKQLFAPVEQNQNQPVDFNITGSGTVWDTTDATNLGFDKNPLNITFSYAGSASRTAIIGNFGGTASTNTSVTGGSGTFTMNGWDAEDFNFTGFSGTWVNNSVSQIEGSLTVPSGMSTSGGGQITYIASAFGFRNITTNNVLMDFSFLLEDAGTEYDISGGLNCSGSITLTNGTFDTNNNNITCSRFISTGSATRAITMGSGTWSLSGTAGAVWDVTTTGLTITANTSTIKLTAATASDRSFVGAGKVYNNIWIDNITPGAKVIFSGSNTFNDFKTNTIAQQLRFDSSTTTTLATWSVNGSSGNVVTLDTTTATGTFSLAKTGGGFIGVRHFSITRSTASPMNTWYADSNSTDGGTNTNWIFGDNITVDCRQYIDYFITRNKRNYFLVVPGVQFIFNPDNETDANDDFTDAGQTADATKASLRTHIKLFTF